MDSKSLRAKFVISGFFYEKDGFTFRKFLNIRRNGTGKEIPDLIVIMMNPGSSHPEGLKKDDQIPNELLNRIVPTVPDNTQNQIMNVMIECNLEYARILNLSDLRDAKSSSFYSKLNDLHKAKINHSIFHDNRTSDFEKLFESKATLIVAWGVNKALRELAETALKKVAENKIGWNKQNIDWAFYHPLPRTAEKQQEWIDEIVKQIK